MLLAWQCSLPMATHGIVTNKCAVIEMIYFVYTYKCTYIMCVVISSHFRCLVSRFSGNHTLAEVCVHKTRKRQ